LTGTTALHSSLQKRSEQWIQECRALATGLGGAGLWLEKISIKTKPVVSIDDFLAGDDALSGLLQAIQNIELDENALATLAEEIAPLRQKLPAEIRCEDDPFDPQQLMNSLEDIKQLLTTRLLSTGPTTGGKG
jgi:hypothetical protein